MLALGEFLRAQKTAGKVIYPPGARISPPWIPRPWIGQGGHSRPGSLPRPGPGSMACVFPCRTAFRFRLRWSNIYREIERDLGIAPPRHGCLDAWAGQGVLLLNAVLTVEPGQAGSHQNKGWEYFTDACIEALGREREHRVPARGQLCTSQGAADRRQAPPDSSRLPTPHRFPRIGAFLGAAIFHRQINILKKQAKPRSTGKCFGDGRLIRSRISGPPPVSDCSPVQAGLMPARHAFSSYYTGQFSYFDRHFARRNSRPVLALQLPEKANSASMMRRRA